MKALLGSIVGLTLCGMTYVVMNSEGKVVIDKGKIVIDSQSDSQPFLKDNGCQPGEENNRLCNRK